MTSKKDYIRASKIVREYYNNAPTIGRDGAGEDIILSDSAQAVENAFVLFFVGDNPQFDTKKFRLACKGNK